MRQQHAKTTLQLLWRASRPYKWRRNLALITATLTLAVGTIVGPLIIAQLLDMIQHGQLQTDSVWTLVIFYGISQLWSEIIGWRIVLYLMWTLETAMQRDIANKVFAKLAGETMFFHSNKFGGSLVSQNSKLSSCVERFWDELVWAVLPLVIFSIVFGVAVFFGSRPMAKLSQREAEASNKVSGNLADMVSNVLAVKSSGAEKIEQQRFDKTNHAWRKASLATMRGFLTVSSVYSTINTSIRIGAIVFAIYAAQHNIVSVAAVYLIITYTGSVARELWNMNSIMRNYNRIIGDAHEMVEILHTPTSLVDKSDKKLHVDRGVIDFDAVTFTHDEGKGAMLFRNFSLHITPGEKVGLVGSSGSGKTTLTKLLLRFADIDSGTIMIDEQNIAEVTQASLRSQIAYVPQEPLLFHRSVRENIAYGKANATDAEIEQAAKKAGAYDFIIKLQDGFNTLVGERGIKLSGGQRQRIAIARAIVKDAPILVLDEATSALDSESEVLIQKSLKTLMQNRTSIVIAHRLSTIAKLDRIIVMHNGKIVEDGSHDQLLKHGGHYAKLWQHQSGGFIDA